MYEASYEYAAEGIEAVVGVLASVFGSSMLSGGLVIAAYVLTALSLYTIAQRRGIKHAWMAWVPVLDLWILGSIADQYRYVVKGEVRSRRKVLLTLSIVLAVFCVVIIVFAFCTMIGLIVEIPQMGDMTENQAVSRLLSIILPAFIVWLLMGVLSIIKAVFEYIALHDVYASCDPGNKTLYLVLSILIGVTKPVFLFVCRSKDDGMPPRRVQQPPVMEEPPVHREPEEPWVNSEE